MSEGQDGCLAYCCTNGIDSAESLVIKLFIHALLLSWCHWYDNSKGAMYFVRSSMIKKENSIKYRRF